MTWGPKRLDLRELLSVKSMMHRSPKGTAGLERRRVRGDNLEPRPPASRKVDVSKRMFCADFISLFLLAIAVGISLANGQVVTRMVDYKNVAV